MMTEHSSENPLSNAETRVGTTATRSAWIGGARPRTLTLAAVPVVLGTAAAWTEGGVSLPLALLALATAVFLQVGVNYSNDYSDGIRGTDEFRRGPVRLTGAGTARPEAVLRVAVAFFVLAAIVGVIIVLVTQEWWLLAVGAAAIVSAWFYTGGSRPYGYAGLGEVSVFIFFGLVATLGTQYVQLGRVDGTGVVSACAAGSFACAVLMVNNIRDIETDVLAGKRTLAVRLGRTGARVAYAVFLIAPYVLLIGFVVHDHAALLALIALALTIPALKIGTTSNDARSLVTALKLTSFSALIYALALGVGLVLLGGAGTE